MRVSSRTPEGSPGRCPICGRTIRVDPSRPSLDAPCPHCGSLVWFGRPQPDRRGRLRTAVRVGLVVLAAAVAVGLAGVAAVWLGLGGQELLLLAVLVVLLFGRSVPAVWRRLWARGVTR
jgi:hypothetical protein